MKKKYQYVIALCFLAAIFASCTKNQKYTIKGDYSDGSLSPTIVITNSSDSIIKSLNFEEGKILIEGNLEKEGFHNILIHYDDSLKTKNNFSVWLSADDLDISFSNNLKEYPTIKSSNKNQIDLNNYYSLLKEESKEANEELIKAELKAKKLGEFLRDEKFNQLYYEVDKRREKVDNAQFIALQKFAKTNPSPNVLFFVIQESSQELVDKHPESYLAMLQNIASEFEGDTYFNDLVLSLKKKIEVSVGKKLAIKIFGKDLKGNQFNQKILEGKKVVLLVFWKAGNDISRTRNADYRIIYKEYSSKGFEIIGINLDKKADWWKTAVKQDNISWPQFSDLKGSSSDNLDYYNIDLIPNNILITKDGEILDINIPISTLSIDLAGLIDKK